MTNGDAALLAGFQPVAPGADIRQGYDEINRLADATVPQVQQARTVRQAQVSNGWTGTVYWVRVGRLVTVAFYLTKAGAESFPAWQAKTIATGLPGSLNGQLPWPETNQYEIPAFGLGVSADGRLTLGARWVDRTFGDQGWVSMTGSYIAATD